jgi:membrane associated rhomboid family serine protease
MIPLRDTAKSKSFPVVNSILIGVCGLLFLYQVSLGDRQPSFLLRYAVIPGAVSSTLFAGHYALHPLVTLVTAMFLHGGVLHLIGNMLYLFIFGDNVEDRLGHGGYLAFYLLAGIGASLVQVWSGPHSAVPVIGASGAIAGVLGASFLLFPRARILTMIPLFVYFPVVELSAFFFLGFWFLMQFLQAWWSGGADAAEGGVAWWAHAGGFVAGALLLPLFLLLRKLAGGRA